MTSKIKKSSTFECWNPSAEHKSLSETSLTVLAYFHACNVRRQGVLRRSNKLRTQTRSKKTGVVKKKVTEESLFSMNYWPVLMAIYSA